MADPTKYKPHFNYSGWEAAGSKRPKPGAELDIDFANIARSIDETIDALKDIRRSDGKLKNGIVDKDALDESARELWESADLAAENAKGSAQSAAGSAASAGKSAEAARGYASDAVSQGNVPIYASVETVKGLNINPNLTAIRTNGYYAPGDGGGALYKRVAIEPSHEGKVQSADGVWWEVAERQVDVRVFGAVPGQDSTAAFQKALEFSAATGVTVVFEGEYIVSPNATSTKTWPNYSDGVISASGGCLIVPPGAQLIGRGTSKSKLLCSSRTGLFVECPQDTRLSGFSLDGGWVSGDANGHGIFVVVNDLDDEFSGFRVKDLRIENFPSYGIGLNYGRFEDVRLDDIYIKHTGSDAVDIKARSPAGTVSTNNYVNNLTAIDFGLRLNGSVALDIRGVFNVDGVFAKPAATTPGGPSGVRLRPGRDDDSNTAVRSNVQNVVVDCSDNPGADGLSLQGNYCNVSNVTVKDPRVGIRAEGSGDSEGTIYSRFNNLSNVVVTGHSEYAFSSTSSSEYLNITNFVAVEAAPGASAHMRIAGHGIVIDALNTDDSAPEMTISTVATESFVLVSRAGKHRNSLSHRGETPTRTILRAVGPGDDIDIHLEPKGVGFVRFGNVDPVGNEEITGVLRIRDADGSIRKLAVME